MSGDGLRGRGSGGHGHGHGAAFGGYSGEYTVNSSTSVCAIKR